MLFHLTSKSPFTFPTTILRIEIGWKLIANNRYEVATDAPGWSQAEAEVARATSKGMKPSAISVKTLKAKRKAGESAAEIYEEEMGEKKKEKGHKKARKGKN